MEVTRIDLNTSSPSFFRAAESRSKFLPKLILGGHV
jgi:hypothetical protein